MALGEVDYGLCGVIGGLTIFIAYFNTIVVGAIGRFYAVAAGKEQSNPEQGLEECRRWFTLAVLIQMAWPALLLIIGYPLGIWAIHNFLTIPADRVADCVWVWRFTCCASYVSMITVPWNAMYTAKQYIAELTIYSFITSTLNAFFIYYMVSHPGVWLVKVSLWGSLLGIVPNVIIALRGVYLFPECRFRWKYVRCVQDLKEIGLYGFWNALGILGDYLRGQGLTLVVNKFFGPRYNAGVTIGTTVSGHCNTLSGSLIGAFSPAIYNAWGSGDHELARRLGYRVCKIGTFLVMIFAIPMMLEVDEVLKLWLKNPPPFASAMCLFVLAETLIEKVSRGHNSCIDAKGVIARFQIVCATCRIALIPIALVLIYAGVGVCSVGWAMLVTMTVCAVVRVWFAKRLVNMNVSYWVKTVLMPLCLVMVAGFMVGSVPSFLMKASFVRVCLTTGLTEVATLPLMWYVVLDSNEKQYLLERITRIKRKIRL